MMTESCQARQLALLLQAIEEVEIEFALKKEHLKDEYGERLTRLRGDLAMLKHEILTGQKPLPLEPVEVSIIPRPTPEIDDALGTPQSVIEARPIMPDQPTRTEEKPLKRRQKKHVQ